MKHMKKLVSFMLAAVMVLAMTVTVSAQEVDTGKGGDAEITVTNATKDATYTLYKVFDATVNDTDENDVKIAYTWPEGKEWKDNDYFAKDDRGNISAKEAAFKDGSTDQLSDNAITWIKANGTEVANAKADDQTLVFKGLDYGYYYVSSTVKENGAITVTSTMPKASIIDKNQKPSWPDEGKTIIGEDGKPMLPDADGKIISDGAFGDEVKFQISVNATNYLDDKKITEYTINDTIDPGLDYNKDSLVVTVGDKTLDAAAGEYTVEWDATTVPAEHAFKLTIPWVDNETDKNLLYDANTLITVTYTTTINKNADIAGEGSEGNKNKAKFEYKTEDNTPHEEEKEEETTTYTYALGIQKTDEKGAPLAGATFKVKQGDKYLTGVKNEDGTYNFTGLVDTEDEATEFETVAEGDNKGQLVIKGVTVGEYEITEVKAPDGYNMLTDSKTVKAERTNATSYKKTYKVYYDEKGNIVKEEEKVTEESYTFPFNVSEITIVNHSGTQLPSTGGIGTTLFYIIGGVLVLGALVLLVTKKRMSRE